MIRARATIAPLLTHTGRRKLRLRSDVVSVQPAACVVMMALASAASAASAIEPAPKNPAGVASHGVAGTRNVAALARERGATLVYVSTDYVFDGSKQGPYVEDDPPRPINA